MIVIISISLFMILLQYDYGLLIFDIVISIIFKQPSPMNMHRIARNKRKNNKNQSQVSET
jgi:hypothetical protein